MSMDFLYPSVILLTYRSTLFLPMSEDAMSPVRFYPLRSNHGNVTRPFPNSRWRRCSLWRCVIFATPFLRPTMHMSLCLTSSYRGTLLPAWRLHCRQRRSCCRSPHTAMIPYPYPHCPMGRTRRTPWCNPPATPRRAGPRQARGLRRLTRSGPLRPRSMELRATGTPTAGATPSDGRTHAL